MRRFNTAFNRFQNSLFRWAIVSTLALLSAPLHAENGVTQKQIVVGQSITLQGGKNDYGLAIQDGIG